MKLPETITIKQTQYFKYSWQNKVWGLYSTPFLLEKSSLSVGTLLTHPSFPAKPSSDLYIRVDLFFIIQKQSFSINGCCKFTHPGQAAALVEPVWTFPLLKRHFASLASLKSIRDRQNMNFQETSLLHSVKENTLKIFFRCDIYYQSCFSLPLHRMDAWSYKYNHICTVDLCCVLWVENSWPNTFFCSDFTVNLPAFIAIQSLLLCTVESLMVSKPQRWPVKGHWDIPERTQCPLTDDD